MFNRCIQNIIILTACLKLLRIRRAYTLCLPAHALEYKDSIAYRRRLLLPPSELIDTPSGASRHRRIRHAETSSNYVKDRFREFVDAITAHSGQVIVVTSQSVNKQPITDVRVPLPSEIFANALEEEGAGAIRVPVSPASQPRQVNRARWSAYEYIDDPSVLQCAVNVPSEQRSSTAVKCRSFRPAQLSSRQNCFGVPASDCCNNTRRNQRRRRSSSAPDRCWSLSCSHQAS